MRNLSKLDCPQVLQDNATTWLQEHEVDPDNLTKKRRYNQKEIKDQIKAETGSKCIYCESLIGHNTPGDIEHLQPVKHHPKMRFVWSNLSLACTECNRRKSDYNDPALPFLNPYLDDVESMLIHYGPLVSWVAGNGRAEATVRTLELSLEPRFALVRRKIEALQDLDVLLDRHAKEQSPVLRELLRKEILRRAEVTSEYSAMIKTALEQNVVGFAYP